MVSAGFFVTVSYVSIGIASPHGVDRKTYSMDPSAPLIMQVPLFMVVLMNTIPNVDVLSGNMVRFC